MRFERIQRLDQVALPTRWQADVGTLSVDDSAAVFAGKKPLTLQNLISVNRIKSNSFAHDVLEVTYAEAETVKTVYFAVAYRRGGAEAINQLYDLLQRACGDAPASVSPGAVEAHKEKLVAARQASNRNAPLVMVLGAVIFFLGVIVTVGSYLSASSGGGFYIIAYGAIFGGLVILLRGVMMKQKSS